MHLTLIAPFRTNLSFDRKWISYDPLLINKLWSEANEKFNGNIENADIGRYLLPIQNSGRYYLDVTEAGETYRQFYLARLLIENDGKNILFGKFLSMPTKSMEIETQILDHGFALLNINIHIDTEALQRRIEELNSLVEVDREINDFAEKVFEFYKIQIHALVESLSTIRYINIDTKLNPIGGTLLWVHKVWAIRPEDPKLNNIAGIRKLISENALKAHLESGTDFWGWGDSIHICDREDNATWREAGWLQGMCLAQYFHMCFDWVYRELPFAIEKIRFESARGRMADAVEIASSFSHRAHLLSFDFMQCKFTIAGVARVSFASLLKSWDTAELSDGLREHIPYIKELATRADEKIKNWSQSSIELMLFISAVLGIVGLSFALHDYLRPTNKRFSVDVLSLPSDFSDVLSISSLSVIIGLLIYGLAKSGMMARFASMFELSVRKLRNKIAISVKVFGVNKKNM